MKNNKVKKTVTTIEALIISLTIEGVNQHLSAYNQTAPHEHTDRNFQVDAARRNAWCDLREATVNLEIKKLGAGSPDKSTKQRQCELAGELEEITAMRKLGNIFDSIDLAAAELCAASCQAKPYSDRLAEMNEKADAMKARLADFQARDIRDELGILESQQNEVRWVRDLFENGRWRTTAMDYRDDYFQDELREMHAQGRYIGELTKEAAELRIESLEQAIAATMAKGETQLTSDEMSAMPQLTQDIANLDAAILEETRYAHFAIATAQFQERRFSKLLEAARISAEGVVEAYQVTREMAALQVA